MRINIPTDREFRERLTAVRRELRAASDAWTNLRLGALGDGSKLSDVYAAAERAQHEAFELKQLFTLDGDTDGG